VLWNDQFTQSAPWCREIADPAGKCRAAMLLMPRVREGDCIGVGTGSSSFVFLQCLGEAMHNVAVIPAAYETRLACVSMGIPVASLLERRPDWSVDGADEIDPDGNLIKGRGGGLFTEKLIMAASPERYIIGGAGKTVNKLGERFPVPVEIFPQALHIVTGGLKRLGAVEVTLRQAERKDGPVICESGGLLLDVRFGEINAALEGEIKMIPGVIESGLFWGYGVTVVK